MRILVVSTNTLLKPLPVLPVGAGMVYSALTAAGFRTRFLDLAFMAEPLEALREELRVTGADLICLSVRNIDNQVIQQPESYLSFLQQVMQVCRICSSAKVLLGGAAMLVMPGELVKELGADYGIKGSGSEAEAVRLAREIERGRPRRQVRYVMQIPPIIRCTAVFRRSRCSLRSILSRTPASKKPRWAIRPPEAAAGTASIARRAT